MGDQTGHEYGQFDAGGKGSTEWSVHPHDRPPDGGGGAPALVPEGAVGESPT